MDLLMVNRRPIMLVGSAGTGKTVLVGDKFAALDPDNFMVTNVPFNYYTTSAMLQAVLDKPLEKKAGRNYGPPGTKKLIYFIDDMNMPMVSNTVAPKCQDLIGALGRWSLSKDGPVVVLTIEGTRDSWRAFSGATRD